MMPRLAVVQESQDHSGTGRESVSVALCTRDGALYIAEQLRSILGQTVPVDQIVISDDASTDSTLELVRAELARAGASAPKIVIVKNATPLGVTRNFEKAISACTSDLIALCDQDDIWVPRRMELFLRLFRSQPDLTLAFSDAQLVDANGERAGGSLFRAISFTRRERKLVRDGRAFDVLLTRNVVTGATTVFRRTLLAAAMPFLSPWVHDEWLAIIAAGTGKVDFIPEQLTRYRQHGANEIGASRPTLGDWVGRVQEPRVERNRRLLARAEALALRLSEWEGSSSRTRQRAIEKVAHEKKRSALPGNRILRLFPVLLSGVKGNYSRFGRARFDMLRDLVQPNR